jgi:hypothetical protein
MFRREGAMGAKRSLHFAAKTRKERKRETNREGNGIPALSVLLSRFRFLRAFAAMGTHHPFRVFAARRSPPTPERLNAGSAAT